jgi:hypothetical protein
LDSFDYPFAKNILKQNPPIRYHAFLYPLLWRNSKVKILLLALILVLCAPLYSLTSPTFLQTLSLPGSNANPQVAVAANGTAMAVWSTSPSQLEIQAAFFNGTAWVFLNHATVPTTITNNIPGFFSTVSSTGSIAFGSTPKVGIDNNGNATLVYVSSNNQIVAARYNQQNLSNVTQLTTTGTTNSSPTLGVNQQGIAVVVWIQAAPYQVFARSFNAAPGGSWGPTVIFMPIPATNTAGIPPNPNGTYPGSFGLGDTQGTSVWLDAPTGTIRSGNFSIP